MSTVPAKLLSVSTNEVITYVNNLEKILHITNKEQWYTYGKKGVFKKNILDRYGSVHNLLSCIYPDKKWLPWKFSKVPIAYWDDKKNQMEYIQWLREELNLKNEDDMYTLSFQTINKFCGGGLLSKYKNSIISLLNGVYPEHKWYPWMFSKVPSTYWRTESNQKEYILWLFDKLTDGKNISYMNGDQPAEEWYSLTILFVQQNYGSGLLSVHRNSLSGMLSSIFPDLKWRVWKFVQTPKNFWRRVENQEKYIRWFEEEFGLINTEMWYDITGVQLKENHGSGLLSIYNNSLFTMLKSLYPTIKWIPWRFKMSPRGTWDSDQNIIERVKEIEEKLYINKKEDWYRISYNQLRKVGASGILAQVGTLSQLLQKAYPHYSWDVHKLSFKFKKASQRWLKICILKLFKEDNNNNNNNNNIEIFEDFVYNGKGNETFELDIWIPSKMLAFEYQGEHHYFQVPGITLVDYTERDQKKKKFCDENGITLIRIPYWWGGDVDSLRETLNATKEEVYCTKDTSPTREE
eukprot:TRINITY_DN2973_c0_g1_i1.p1 TRINITY_DN2973_c0_g1~~TRINITY_DN2973_c0_g1_i1.p1  ORF type:complete len:519 (+),score=100.26 TRINITY_DN2973_c0_g1_i1:46-1602(+)